MRALFLPLRSINSSIASILSGAVALLSVITAVFWLPDRYEPKRIGLIPVEVYSDLGKIEQAEIKATVRLRNTMEQPVRIIEVSAACRCTVAKPSEDPIKAGAEYELPFEWDTRGMRNSSSTALTVQYLAEGDSMPRSEVVQIIGEVQPRYDVEPSILSFSRESPRKVVVVLKDRTLGRQPVIKKFTSESPAVSIERLSESSVEVVFAPDKWKDSPGFRPNVILSVDVELEPSLDIPIQVTN